MNQKSNLDYIVVGYNEIPFERYESFLRGYGEHTEAYRDLKFSFVDVDGKKMDYMDLLNYSLGLAKNNHNGFSPVAEFRSGDMPSLAATYLTSFLRNHGHTTKYINLFQNEKEKLIEYLAQNPSCVAITTTFYVVNLPVNEIVEFIRQHNPRVKIVVGGPLVANHVRQSRGDTLKAALSDMGADIYVIEAQGELTLATIVETLKNGGDLKNIPNIAYFEKNQLQRTKVVPENNLLDENFIDWRGFSDEQLGPTLQMRTARSCPFKCAFCNYPTRAGALALASVDVVEKELDSMHALGNVRNVVIIDDTFNVPYPRFKEICRMMIRNNYQFNWFSYFRCSNSDQEGIELMARSGCKGVFLGIESGSPTVLKNMNKAATIEKYAKGIEMLRRHGIMTFGSFITGFPGETEQTVQETVDFIREVKPDYYRSQVWYCEPGAPIQNERAKYQINGDGFVWSHATMDSLEAMDHIDRMFLTIDESLWLPQWSFDFWTIPYLIGRGFSFDRFKAFMTQADKILKLEIASVPERQKQNLQNGYLQSIVAEARSW